MQTNQIILVVEKDISEHDNLGVKGCKERRILSLSVS